MSREPCSTQKHGLIQLAWKWMRSNESLLKEKLNERKGVFCCSQLAFFFQLIFKAIEFSLRGSLTTLSG